MPGFQRGSKMRPRSRPGVNKGAHQSENVPMIGSGGLSSTTIAEVGLPGVVGEKLWGPVHWIKALVEEGKLNITGAIRSADIVKVGGFLKMKSEDRFGEKIGSE